MVNMKRIVDLQINIDGLILGGGETVDGFIEKIESIANSHHEITCQVLAEELYD